MPPFFGDSLKTVPQPTGPPGKRRAVEIADWIEDEDATGAAGTSVRSVVSARERIENFFVPATARGRKLEDHTATSPEATARNTALGGRAVEVTG